MLVITVQHHLNPSGDSKLNYQNRIHFCQDINYYPLWQKGKNNSDDFISQYAITLQKLPQNFAED